MDFKGNPAVRPEHNLNYGIIGNCRSAALVSDVGSIDWCCLPDFDSPSVFAALLDRNMGGSFSITPLFDCKITQAYQKRTNILETTFEGENDMFQVIDFMPRYKTEDGNYYMASEIYRYVRYVKGTPRVIFRYDPRLNYAGSETSHQKHKKYLKSFSLNGSYESVYLYTGFKTEDIVNGKPQEITADGYFLMSYNEKIIPIDLDRIYLEYQRTKVYWLNWVNRSNQFTLYNAQIIRSALVLKLLTYQKTGAILAAVTTSLPESIGDERNWDYRYCWIRDASMIIRAQVLMGHFKSANAFLDFVLTTVHAKNGKIQIMYGIRGERKLKEKTLDYLSGYENSKPVRIGNSAYIQKQNDIFGILMDVIYQGFTLFPGKLDEVEELWTLVRSIVRDVEGSWSKPDRGIWELRNEYKHFVFSKVLSWVAIDRAVKIARLLNRNEYVKEWKPLAEKIRKDIHEKGWNEEVGAFTQAYGSPFLDAANLQMENLGFISASDPRYISTVLATQKELCRDGLMYRYKNADDFGTPKSAFTICTFWLTESLCKIGKKNEAIKLFERVLSYGNHLGLFSEDIDFETKRLLGNFPQGYSHLALIQTAALLGSDLPSLPLPFKFRKP